MQQGQEYVRAYLYSNAHDIESFIVRAEIPSTDIETPMQFNYSRDHSNRSLGSLTVVARFAPKRYTLQTKAAVMTFLYGRLLAHLQTPFFFLQIFFTSKSDNVNVPGHVGRVTLPLVREWSLSLAA